MKEYLEWILIVIMILNFSSLTMTVFMMGNACAITENQICVKEANPLPAYIFDNFGYLSMYLILVLFWYAVLKFGTIFGDKDEKVQIVFYVAVIILFSPAVTLDFIRNFQTLSLVLCC
jgi:hypothetical protein